VRLRFQADEDFNQTIVLAIIRREPGIDFQTATQAGLKGRQDPEVLAFSAKTGRILVTHDVKTMPGHFARLIQEVTSPGVLLVPQHLSIAEAVEEIVLLWYATDASEWTNRIVWLPL
jgi:predicted nuclease of predicted toxin-antitoxin system